MFIYFTYKQAVWDPIVLHRVQGKGKGKVKVKVIPEQAMKAQTGTQVLLYSFFNLGAR